MRLLKLIQNIGEEEKNPNANSADLAKRIKVITDSIGPEKLMKFVPIHIC